MTQSPPKPQEQPVPSLTVETSQKQFVKPGMPADATLLTEQQL